MHTTSAIMLTNPNVIIAEDKGSFANSTPLDLAFVSVEDQLLHLKTSFLAAKAIFAF